ncbi:MAG: DUF2236 domain-containing protein [Solirubrobacteraceae bacterium]|nr:DUF2236 domain-containing protein [Solirubrobacteraceae bacterium]
MRLFAASAYALILQTAHPTVGAGVAQYSGFAADPWGRLLRTLDYVSGSIYGGPQLAGEIGARVRNVHKTIKGIGADGQRYHALEPDAFAWVHGTLAASVIDGHAALGRQITPAEREQFWQEWKALGRFIGVRDRDLPEDWDGFRLYFDRTCADVLVAHPTVDEVFATLDAPKGPPIPGFPDWLWNAVRGPVGAPVKLISIGLLPPLLRERFGLPWTPAHEAAFNGLTRAIRMSGPLLLPQLREFGPVYVKVRRKQLHRGDVAARTPPRREHALV